MLFLCFISLVVAVNLLSILLLVSVHGLYHSLYSIVFHLFHNFKFDQVSYVKGQHRLDYLV